MLRRLLPALACLALAPALPIAAQTTQTAPPKTWVDKDTGHRVWRLTDEPNSGGFYFNINGYTPDHKTMIYTAPDGIHVIDMETHEDASAGSQSAAPRRRTPAGPGAFFRFGVHALVAGFKTNSVFYTQTDPKPKSLPSTRPTSIPARSASSSTCPRGTCIVSHQRR